MLCPRHHTQNRSAVYSSEPADVTLDEDIDGEPVYRFENEDGDTSAVRADYLKHIQRIFEYDPTKDLSAVRIHPHEAPQPVMFRNRSGDGYIAIAPWVAD